MSTSFTPDTRISLGRKATPIKRDYLTLVGVVASPLTIRLAGMVSATAPAKTPKARKAVRP